MRRPAMLITRDRTYLDGVHTAVTPDPDQLTLPDLLVRAGAMAEVVLIGKDMLKTLGLPKGPPADRTSRNNPALKAAQAAGWTCNRIHPEGWSTFAPDGDYSAAVYVGVEPWIDTDRNPLVVPDDPSATVRRLTYWREETGVPGAGTPGVVGSRWLKHALTGRDRLAEPRWKLDEPGMLHELWAQEENAQWRIPAPDASPLFGFDTVSSYLAALTTAPIARGKLLSGKTPYRPGLAGMWLCKLAPWTHKDMPHPAGPREEYDRAWCAPDTMELLTKLTEQGVYGGYEVIHSWTGGATRDMGAFGAILRKFWQDNAGSPGAKFAKELSREVPQMFTGAYINRGDWRASVYSSARSKLWRRTWNIGRPGGIEPGVFPRSWGVDAVYYGPDESGCRPVFTRADGQPEFPPATEDALALGTFHYITRNVPGALS